MPPNMTIYYDSVYEQGFECPLITDSHVTTKLALLNLCEEKDVDYSANLNRVVSVTKCLPKVKRQIHIHPLLSSISFFKYYNKKKVSLNAQDPLLLAIEQAREVNGKSNASKVSFDLTRNEIIDSKTEPPMKSSCLIPSSSDVNVTVKSIINDAPSPIKKSKQDIGGEASFFTNLNVCRQGDTFREFKLVSKQIRSHLHKGKKELSKFNYTNAADHFVTASEKLKNHGYPPDHSLQKETYDLLQYTYHAEKTLEYSVQIVKMGLRHEAREELHKALKKYTVAYQMRKDLLSHPLPLQLSHLNDQPQRHPSLAVLLNLIGAVQVKMGELDEALQLYELSLYEQRDDRDIVVKDTTAPGTTAVTMREIGSIHEQRGDLDLALTNYLDSLDFVLSSAYYRADLRKQIHGRSVSNTRLGFEKIIIDNPDVSIIHASSVVESPNHEMEVYIQKNITGVVSKVSSNCNLATYYEGFFQKKITTTRDTEKTLIIHLATTLQSIANIHKMQGDKSLAIQSYYAALRGMKVCYGDKHTNVSSLLSNFGTFLQDIKEYEKALEMYKEVLKIESLRLGFNHHEVMVTMLNMALLEKSRGRYDESIALYEEILNIQKKRGFDRIGEPTLSLIAVASSCLAEVQEIIGDINGAIESLQQAITVRSHSLVQSHPDVGDVLRKLGTLYYRNHKYKSANTYYIRALKLYKLANVAENDSRVIGTKRDMADNQANLR
jgi:tetratricopeptide (TPR) repeat protein